MPLAVLRRCLRHDRRRCAASELQHGRQPPLANMR